ncbi:hypothetical protein J2790_004265 [Paenarthrobacter nicotinovorans]|uniref:hypothetical protein n=1 Tax=Micrococcaceae TaxID=1268 RepID=UPI0008769BB2|nr:MULTISPECIES: hypothetical protein [Micrococcaceae]MDR6439090.1 hypothetical protein [Paenarthrobacter nicotinovorans]SCZ65332.1 hypothetical protein SAMN02799638_04154 [Arthrobacter sp. UNCCL28]
MSASDFLADPRVAEHLDPEILVYLTTNLPAEGVTADEEAGHWIAHIVALLQQVRELKQRVRELEADA